MNDDHTDDHDNHADLPLHGVRVLDLTRLLPGAICTLMLAELGADVIKVESADGGDYARWMPPLIDGYGAYFRATNHGKRSIIVNLKDANGLAVLHRLAATADVLVESFRPGTLARLGADAARLHAINPGLVYCAISGYGQTGDRAADSGHDLIYTALTGLIGEMGVMGGGARVPGGQIADVSGAYVAVSGILAALLRRARTGKGAVIDAALTDAALPITGWAWAETVMRSFDPSAGRGLLTGGYACYNIYTTADGHPVALAALEPKFWVNFCTAIKRDDLRDDHTAPDRQPYLHAELIELFAGRDRATWDALLLPADCCYSLIPTMQDVIDDEATARRSVLVTRPDGTPILHSPIHIDGLTPVRRHAPGYGEHTTAVLREAGYSDETIAALTAQGSITQGETR